MSARAIAGTNAALDVEASLPRYLEELRRALEEEFPGVLVDVAVGEDECRAEGASAEERAVLELRAAGVARAVRHCGRWPVFD